MITIIHVGDRTMLMNGFRDVIRIPIYREPAFDILVGKTDPIRQTKESNEYKFIYNIGEHYFYALYPDEYNNVMAHAHASIIT